MYMCQRVITVACHVSVAAYDFILHSLALAFLHALIFTLISLVTTAQCVCTKQHTCTRVKQSVLSSHSQWINLQLKLISVIFRLLSLCMCQLALFSQYIFNHNEFSLANRHVSLALFPGPLLYVTFEPWPEKRGRGPGKFYHVSDIKGRKKVFMFVGEQDHNNIYTYALHTVELGKMDFMTELLLCLKGS